MKARVKATGEIVDVVKNSFTTEIYDINGVKRTLDCTIYLGAKKNYREDELEFDVDYDPDYWTRLEHQYAGMAMQGIVSSYEAMREISKERDIPQYVANMAFGLAHALVEKLKESK